MSRFFGSSFSSRANSFLDFAHRVTINSMIVVAVAIAYNSTRILIDRRKDLKQWEKDNPAWETDPFFVYDPNYMRHLKKPEEEILLTRPYWYAAKELREKRGIPLQPPYMPIANPLMGRDGRVAPVGTDGFEKDVGAALGTTSNR